MTIYEKYYAMNAAINTYMKGKGISSPVYKYGIVPKNQPYPYFQTTIRVTYRQPHGTSQSGTLTNFEYTLNYFTAAKNENENDAALFIPYEVVREAIVSPNAPIWEGIANVYEHSETPEFSFKGGLEVLQKGLLFSCQAVVTHITEDEYTMTDVDEAVAAATEDLSFE